MEKAELLAASEIIGCGLQHGDITLELVESRGEGWYWPLRLDDVTCGVWCPAQHWHQHLVSVVGTADVKMLDPALLPCLSASILAPLEPWIGEAIATVPVPFTLLPGAYPLLSIIKEPALSCALVDWPIARWQTQVTHWAPFTGRSISVTLSLVAGWCPLSAEDDELTQLEKGDGLWLDGDVVPEEGQALIWWHRPLAQVNLSKLSAGSVEVGPLCPSIRFVHPPLVAELAQITLPLSSLGSLMEGEQLHHPVTFNAKVHLCLDEHVLGSGCLLRGDNGLILQLDNVRALPDREAREIVTTMQPS